MPNIASDTTLGGVSDKKIHNTPQNMQNDEKPKPHARGKRLRTMRKAEPRVIDFSRVHGTYDREHYKVTPEQENANQEQYQAILTAIRGGERPPVKRRPVVDVTKVNAAVLQHLRTVAKGLRDREGYKSQFVQVTKPVHTHLGGDPDAVLDHVWHEVWTTKATSKKDDLPEDHETWEGWTVMDASGEMELTRWMWKDKIPLGELSILGAYEGHMKSTMVANIVADVTHGRLEGEYYGEPKSVLWFGGEESWNKTIKPRLVAAGADVSRVKQIKPPKDDRRVLDVTDPDHIAMLRKAMKAYDAVFIVFDPMTSSMGGHNVDSEDRLRAAIEPFIEAVCHTDGASVLAIKHFTKVESADPSILLGGNRGWSQIARSFLAIASHPESSATDPRFVVGVHKGNMTGDRTAHVFKPVAKTLQIEDRHVEVATIEWSGESEYTPHEALRARLAAERGQTTKDKPARQTAESWLRDFLKESGPTTRKDVLRLHKAERVEAGLAPFSDRSLDNAWGKLTDAGLAGARTRKGKEIVWSLVGHETTESDDPAI